LELKRIFVNILVPMLSAILWVTKPFVTEPGQIHLPCILEGSLTCYFISGAKS
jgi:hypothetical protein